MVPRHAGLSTTQAFTCYCTAAAQGPTNYSGCLSLFSILPAKQKVFKVEPRGFEPLTSAVQRLTPMFQPVLACPVMWLNYAVFDVFEKLAFLLHTSLY
jgi:hypothetical protein